MQNHSLPQTYIRFSEYATQIYELLTSFPGVFMFTKDGNNSMYLHALFFMPLHLSAPYSSFKGNFNFQYPQRIL